MNTADLAPSGRLVVLLQCSTDSFKHSKMIILSKCNIYRAYQQDKTFRVLQWQHVLPRADFSGSAGLLKIKF